MIEYRIIAHNLQALKPMGVENWQLSAIHDNKMFFFREIKKKVERKPIESSDPFESFYRKYPNKKAKRDAIVMWNRLNENERELALDGIERYIQYWKIKGVQKEHIPHPATWLNGRRWEDDLSQTVFVPPKPSIEKIKKEEEEQKIAEMDKKLLNQKIERIQKDPVEWKRLRELADSKLTDEQKASSLYETLLSMRIRMIVSNEL